MPFEPDGPFRGSTAVAAGLLTRGVLRGPRFQKLFPDVYAPAHLENDLQLRSRAAGVLIGGRGVIAGYSAAELLGASSGPAAAPAEVLLTAPRCQSYACAGLQVHRDRIGPGETTRVGGVAVTTPERTAFDLARWAPTLTERVAAVDALAHHRRVDLADITVLRHRHLGARKGGEVAQVLGLADGRAESPMESRARMALVLGGLPPPAVQHLVVVRGRRYYLDLAYPRWRVAIEYDGADHRTQRRAAVTWNGKRLSRPRVGECCGSMRSWSCSLRNASLPRCAPSWPRRRDTRPSIAARGRPWCWSPPSPPARRDHSDPGRSR